MEKSVLWSEYRSGSSYLSGIVRDVIGLIEEKLGPSLITLEANREVMRFPVKEDIFVVGGYRNKVGETTIVYWDGEDAETIYLDVWADGLPRRLGDKVPHQELFEVLDPCEITIEPLIGGLQIFDELGAHRWNFEEKKYQAPQIGSNIIKPWSLLYSDEHHRGYISGSSYLVVDRTTEAILKTISLPSPYICGHFIYHRQDRSYFCFQVGDEWIFYE